MDTEDTMGFETDVEAENGDTVPAEPVTVCDVCGFRNPGIVAICAQCSNYLDPDRALFGDNTTDEMQKSLEEYHHLGRMAAERKKAGS